MAPRSLSKNPVWLSTQRTWSIADFGTDRLAGTVRSVALTLPIGSPLTDKLGFELARGTIYWDNAFLALTPGGHLAGVEAALGYRNLEGGTEIRADDSSVIMYWKWFTEFEAEAPTRGGGSVWIRDHTNVSVETADGRGVLAVTNQLFLNIRWFEGIAGSWAVPLAAVRFEVRVLGRFKNVSGKDLQALLADAVTLQ